MKTALLTLLAAAAPLLLPGVEEEVVPTGFPVSRYTAIWENSPFNREVVPAVATTIQSSFAQSLVLEGMVTDDVKGPVAYVRDVREDKSIVITSVKTDDHPYIVVSANQSRKPEETKVTVTDGNETGEIGFAAATLTQPIAQPASVAPRQNPNQPNRDPKTGAPIPQAGSGQVLGNQPGGGQSGGARAAGPITPMANPTDTNQPTSVTPALEALDSEPRRRRVPLPGN